MGIDYYGALSLKRTCTDLEIKKAYRRLALQFNPQRLENEKCAAVFALIGEAYDVLSNSLRRAIFDQFGEEGLKKGVPGPGDTFFQPYTYHADPYRTYREFFGTASPYADLLDAMQANPPLYNLPEGKGIKKKQDPLYHPLGLTLEEVFHGGVKKMKIHRLVFVSDDETRTEIKEKILSIPIKPGLRPGTEIRFPEEGDHNPTQIPADVIFVTGDRPHPVFHRVNDDLVMTWKLSLEDALMGTTVTVHTLDNRTIRIPITDVITPDYEKIVPNEGMVILEEPNEKGSLIIKFDIQFPSYLPRNSKNMIQKAFHLAKIGGGYDQHEMINKLVLVDKMKRVDRDEQEPPV